MSHGSGGEDVVGGMGESSFRNIGGYVFVKGFLLRNSSKNNMVKNERSSEVGTMAPANPNRVRKVTASHGRVLTQGALGES